MSSPTVFISYSHKDELWKERLVTQLRVLQMEGVLEVWDDRRIEAGLDWRPEIEQAIERAAVAILLVSADFLTSKFILGEEVPRLLERRQKEGLRVIPLIVRPCAWQAVKWLSPIQARPKDGRPLSSATAHQIEVDLAALALEVAGIIRRAGPVTRGSKGTIAPEKISLAKLPSTSPDLFGRERELAALDAAWETPGTNVVTLVAFGGVGKTALVNLWLNRMGQKNWRGADRVFGWSFYSQGAAEGRQASADLFIATALGWFGDPDPKKGSPWEKGERLAELVRKQRTLLVLDGVEPLQQPPEGRLKDPALQTLLRELAHSNPGLCIVSTRLAVDDLKDFAGTSVETIDLEDLAPEDGARYLGHLGIKGTDEELRQAAKDMDGHALALTLLGTYLATGHGGDIRKRDLVPRLTAEAKHGEHARGIMEAYERWFEGKPEQDILRLMGLFDRPAEPGPLRVLRQPPAIPGLTERLQKLSEYPWNLALDNLRQARLLDPKDPEAPDSLDCHPLVREHFGEQLEATGPAAWREAHGRLYEHYSSAAKGYPDTIEEMTPLYAAVAHGCQAGRYQEAFNEVYRRRIHRGDEFFSLHKLGAFGADLAALAGFFDPPWEKPAAGLTEPDKAFVLNEAGFDLRALGRLGEAVEPMRAGLDADIAGEDWGNAAISAGNLSELHLTLGDIGQAVAYAEQSVQLADRSGDAFRRMAFRTTLADALHQAGRLQEAETLFQEAERMQQERQPGYPLLYSLWGFRYCDLLLGQGKYQEVCDRAAKTVAWAEPQRVLLAIALDHLSFGRAREGTGDLREAESHLNQAVTGLRQAGYQDDLSRGLLSRASFYRLRGDFPHAQRDLDEALLIATRSQMRLHEADCQLEQARLALATGDPVRARTSFARARTLIQETGYRRRDAELTALEEQLGHAGSQPSSPGSETV
jgi:tetratricopeptide (TPR) repeat protein